MSKTVKPHSEELAVNLETVSTIDWEWDHSDDNISIVIRATLHRLGHPTIVIEGDDAKPLYQELSP